MSISITVRYSFIVGFALIISAGTVSGLRCLECQDSPHPQLCNVVTECPDGDLCNVQQYITSGGLILYSTGCMSKQRCSINKRNLEDLEMTGIRTERSGDIITCTECCVGEFCNIGGCGQTATKQPDRGPICFQCTAQSDQDTCRDITKCDIGELCSVSKLHPDDMVWKSECLSKTHCDQMTNEARNTGGCSMCCQGDFCNDHCQPLPSLVPVTDATTSQQTTQPTPVTQSTTATTAATTPTTKATTTTATTMKATTTTAATTTKATTTWKATTTKATTTAATSTEAATTTKATTITAATTTTMKATTTKATPVTAATTTKATTTKATTTKTATKGTTAKGTTMKATTTSATTALTTSAPRTSHAATPTSTSAQTHVSTVSMSTEKSSTVHNVHTTTEATISTGTNFTSSACPLKPADLIFALDGSGSLGTENFRKQLAFVSNFTSQFEIGPNKTRVALVTYGTGVQNKFFLNNYTTKASVLNHIGTLHYPDGETYTHEALGFVEHSILAPENGGRRNVTKIVIVMTDGRSNEPNKTNEAAFSLKKNPQVEVTAIGIGHNVDPVELRSIATDNNHTFQVPSFDALHTIQAELTDTTCNTCKNARSDICFVLDSSGSEGKTNFQKQLEFLNLVINEFTVDGNKATRFCVITFSNEGRIEIHLDSYRTKQGLLENVPKINYRDGETRTDLGLFKAHHELYRSTTNKIVVVLTDGRSLEPAATIFQAHRLQKTGTEVISIGIGQNIDRSELVAMASGSDHVFQVHGFDQLDNIHQLVVDEICQKASQQRPTVTAPLIFG